MTIMMQQRDELREVVFQGDGVYCPYSLGCTLYSYLEYEKVASAVKPLYGNHVISAMIIAALEKSTRYIQSAPNPDFIWVVVVNMGCNQDSWHLCYFEENPPSSRGRTAQLLTVERSFSDETEFTLSLTNLKETSWNECFLRSKLFSESFRK